MIKRDLKFLRFACCILLNSPICLHLMSCKQRLDDSLVRAQSQAEAGSLERRLGIIHKLEFSQAFSGSIRKISRHDSGIVALATNRGEVVLLDESNDQILSQAHFSNRKGQAGDATALYFSKFGDQFFIVVGQSDGSISTGLWNRGMMDVKLANAPQQHDLPIRSIDLTDAQDVIATGGEDGQLNLWQLRAHNLQLRLDFSGSLALGKDQTSAAGISVVKFIANQTLVAARGDRLEIWDLSLTEPVLFTPQFQSPDSRITAVHITTKQPACTDAQITFSVGTETGELAFLGTKTDLTKSHQATQVAQLRPFGQKQQAHTAALMELKGTQDGKFLISGSVDGMIRLWDACTFKLLRQVGSHAGFAVAGLAIPDKFASGRVYFAPEASQNAYYWDLKATNEPLILESSPTSQVASSSDGKFFAFVSTNEKLSLWSTTSLKTTSANPRSALGNIPLSAPAESMIVTHPLATSVDAYVFVSYCSGWIGRYKYDGTNLNKISDFGSKSTCKKPYGRQKTYLSTSLDESQIYFFSTLDKKMLVQVFDGLSFKVQSEASVDVGQPAVNILKKLTNLDPSNSTSTAGSKFPRSWYDQSNLDQVTRYMTVGKASSTGRTELLGIFNARMSNGQLALVNHPLANSPLTTIDAYQAQFFQNDQYLMRISKSRSQLMISDLFDLKQVYDVPVIFSDLQQPTPMSDVAPLNAQIAVTAGSRGGMLWWIADQISW